MMSDNILREMEAIAKDAWEDREADEILDAIEEKLESKYRQCYPELKELEILFETMAAFQLPWSNNEVYTVSSKATVGSGIYQLVQDNTDAFLVTTCGVTLLERVEIFEEDEG